MRNHSFRSLVPARLIAVFLASLPVTALAQTDPAKAAPEAPPAPPAATPAPPAPPPPPPPETPAKVDDAPKAAIQKDANQAAGRSPEPEEPKVKVHEPIDVVRYGDFMDTRLTWVFGDDDVTKSNGEVFPLSPNPSVGDRPQYRLFFDNLNSRFAGRENLTHLVLYRKLPGFIPDLDTEAAIVLRVDMGQLAARSNNVNSAFYDSGSYLRLFYKTGSYDVTDARTGKVEKRKTGVDLVFFPLDTDRFRLGYLYDLSWGGTAQSINQSIFPRLAGQAPGAKFQYTGAGYYFFAGLKTAQIVEPQTKVTDSQDIEFTRIQQTNYGLLAGGGADFSDMVRLDVGGGYFQQGRFEQREVEGKRVYTYGASGRLVFHDRMPVPASVDFALYRNDPNSPMVIFRPEKYEEGVTAWAISLEGSHLRQNLKEFNNAATKLQGASAGAIQATLKSGYFRVQGTAILRDVPFVLRNQPSYIPFETIPKDAKTQSEMFFALAADYHLAGSHLTPNLGLGLQLPSTFGSSQVDIFGTDIGRTVVIRQQGNLALLPEGKGRVPIIQARASLRWDLSPIMAAVFWGQYARDNNATRLEKASDGTNYLRTFVAPDFIGFGTAVQARF